MLFILIVLKNIILNIKNPNNVNNNNNNNKIKSYLSFSINDIEYKYEINYILPKAFIVFDKKDSIRVYSINNLPDEIEINNDSSDDSLNLIKTF